MFVNDTTRLPDSGRVCIMGFQADPAAPSTYYSVTVVAARAEVEPMAEPRNPAHVLGVGSMVESIKGPVFAGYFAASRERFDTEPNYKNGLFVLVDGAVYGVRKENISTTLRRGFSTRRFTLLRDDRPQRTVEYSWPWYREPFMSANAGPVRSSDFLRELSVMVRAYA